MKKAIEMLEKLIEIFKKEEVPPGNGAAEVENELANMKAKAEAEAEANDVMKKKVNTESEYNQIVTDYNNNLKSYNLHEDEREHGDAHYEGPARDAEGVNEERYEHREELKRLDGEYTLGDLVDSQWNMYIYFKEKANTIQSRERMKTRKLFTRSKKIEPEEDPKMKYMEKAIEMLENLIKIFKKEKVAGDGTSVVEYELANMYEDRAKYYKVTLNLIELEIVRQFELHVINQRLREFKTSGDNNPQHLKQLEVRVNQLKQHNARGRHPPRATDGRK